jgi:hypothetical protein
VGTEKPKARWRSFADSDPRALAAIIVGSVLMLLFDGFVFAAAVSVAKATEDNGESALAARFFVVAVLKFVVHNLALILGGLIVLGLAPMVGGLVTASIVNDRQVSRAFQAGMIPGLVAPWLLDLLVSENARPDPRPPAQWNQPRVARKEPSPAGAAMLGMLAVSVLVNAGSASVGGWVQKRMLRRFSAESSRQSWTYMTAGQREIPIIAPWRSPRLARYWRWSGWIAGIVILSVFGFGLLGVMSGEWYSALWPWSIVPVLDLLLIIVALAWGLSETLKGQGMKHLSESVERIMADDTRPPVLYLRSFLDDGRTEAIGGFEKVVLAFSAVRRPSHEQHLARVLKSVGPLIAIGRPGEPLPELGAARLYVADAHWRDVVADLLARARLVLFQLGVTPNLRWELDQVKQRVSPERVLIFLPHCLSRNREKREAEQHALLAWAGEALVGLPPGELDSASFIYFDHDDSWTARALSIGDAVSSEHPLSELLRRLAKDRAFQRRSSSGTRETLTRLLAALVILTLLISSVVVFLWQLWQAIASGISYI